MLTCIVVVLVLLNSFQIFSITHASSDGVISQILFEETGMSMFETILKNMPSNQSNYELLHATKIVDTCLNDLMQIRAELQSLDINALQMVDSWGKLPSGLLTGNLYDFGSFDECFDVQIKRWNTDEFIHPQYCLAKIFILSEEQTIPRRIKESKAFVRLDNSNMMPRMALLKPENSTISLNTGICIPASCSPKFIEGILGAFLNKSLPSLVPTVDVSPEWCQLEKKPSEFTTIDIVTITILVSAFYLIIMSTSYDIVCSINKRKKRNIFVVFSAYTNGRKIFCFQRNKSPDVIDCLNGIRAITTAWIIFGHCYFMHIAFPTKNKTEWATWVTRYSSTFINAASLSVETFFVLSGLLVTLMLLKRLEKSNGHLNIFGIYFHRYIRLIPLLVIVILFQSSVIKFFSDGPLWVAMVDESKAVCKRDWWKLLLFVHNYDSNDFNICIPFSWYLSVDMQLFVVAPVIVWFLYRFKLKFLPFIILAIFLSIAIVFYEYIFHEDLAISNFVQLISFPTYIRMLTWLEGVILGYIVYHTRNKRIHIPKAINVLAWVVSITILAAAVLTIYPLTQIENTPPIIYQALYNVLSRVLWALALCYIIFACIHNYGGPINWFLSLELWQPVSRLSYATYLAQFGVMTIYNGSMREVPYFLDIFIIHKFLYYYTMSFLVGTLASLAFESPIVALEKMTLRSKANTKSVRMLAPE